MILGIFLFVLIIIIISLIISFFDNNRFIVRNYEVTSAKISKSFRICLLTDLHGKSYGNNNEKLIEAIDEAAPDIIISAGDIHGKNSTISKISFLNIRRSCRTGLYC